MKDNNKKTPPPPVHEKEKAMNAFLKAEPQFENVEPLLESPLEITRSMLRLLNMMDETVIIHDDDAPEHNSIRRRL